MIIKDGYIVAVADSDENHDAIISKIQNKPSDPDGFIYRLRKDDLEWELVKLPDPEPIDEEAGPEDYEQALEEMGVNFND